MAFNVQIFGQAERDLDEIVAWLAKRSLRGADRWIEAFDAAKVKLSENPQAFALAPENDFIDVEIRHILFKTRRGRRYRALYTIVGNEVRILHVRGSDIPYLSEISH